MSDKLQSQVFIAMPLADESHFMTTEYQESLEVDVPSDHDDPHDVVSKSKLLEPKPQKRKEEEQDKVEKNVKKKDFIAQSSINVKSNK